MLKRVFYISEITDGTTMVDVQSIVSSSTVWNRRHDVTGLLISARRNFAQVLEGRDEYMEAVMRRIRADTRHHSIRIVVDEPISLRLFGRWSMALVQRDDLSDALARLCSVGNDPVVTQSLLRELARASEDLGNL